MVNKLAEQSVSCLVSWVCQVSLHFLFWIYFDGQPYSLVFGSHLGWIWGKKDIHFVLLKSSAISPRGLGGTNATFCNKKPLNLRDWTLYKFISFLYYSPMYVGWLFTIWNCCPPQHNHREIWGIIWNAFKCQEGKRIISFPFPFHWLELSQMANCGGG